MRARTQYQKTTTKLCMVIKQHVRKFLHGRRTMNADARSVC